VNHLALSELLTGTQRLYARFMLKRAVSLSDLVITDSHFSKREIQERLGVDEGRVRIISIGIDRDHFRTVKDAEARDRVRAKYGLPERYLLFVGNVKPHKNVVSLVRAFERLMGDADRKIGLVIVGQREGFITGDRNLSILLEGNDRLNRAVRFTGRVQAEELPVLYSMADLFVFPSLYEGFGMPPLEAMACGCPVAASNAASIPEVCGDAVRYFDPLDSDALAGLIAELLDDEAARSELVRRGFRRVSRFSWEESARAHSALLRKVAAP
jgi:glycosyltransferase involved in cell wall biosynthesis